MWILTFVKFHYVTMQEATFYLIMTKEILTKLIIKTARFHKDGSFEVNRWKILQLAPFIQPVISCKFIIFMTKQHKTETILLSKNTLLSWSVNAHWTPPHKHSATQINIVWLDIWVLSLIDKSLVQPVSQWWTANISNKIF